MNKLRIAQSFSRAAETYDNAAHLQRSVGEYLFQLLPHQKTALSIVDVGCGTGFFTHKLAVMFSQACVCGVDIADGMLGFAKSRYGNTIRWVCADAENMPLCDNSVDIIFSSLAMQWCENTSQFLSEVKRVLKPNGVAVLSTFGSATLNELKRAWEHVDHQSHVNRFLSTDELKQIIKGNYFSSSFIRSEIKIVMYESPIALMRELKYLGAQEVTERNASGLMGKKRFDLFLDEYRKIKEGNLFPSTYEVIYITLTK